MESLSCTMVDHESKSQVIKGICIDENCKAPMRILCVICQNTYHSTCQRGLILDKLEILYKLQNNNKISRIEDFLSRLKLLKEQYNSQIEKIDKFYQYLLEQEKNLQQRVEQLVNITFSRKIWNECAELLQSKEDLKEIQEITKFKVSLKQISDLTQDLLNTNQSKAQEQCTRSCINQSASKIKIVTQNGLTINEKFNYIPNIQSGIQINRETSVLKNALMNGKLNQDPNTGIQITGERLLMHYKSVIKCVDISPCGQFIIIASQKDIIMHDEKQFNKEIRLVGHTQTVSSIKYSRDGKLIASGSSDGSVIIWDVKSLKQLGNVVQVHQGEINSISFSPDCLHLLSGSSDGTVRVRDYIKYRQIVDIKVGYQVMSVEYSPNGLQILSSGLQSIIQIWEVKNQQLLFKLIGHSQAVNQAQYSLDGRFIVSGSEDNSIILWDASTGKQIRNKLVGHLNGVRTVSFSPDGKYILSGSTDSTLRLWNFATGQQVFSNDHPSRIERVQFSSDGTKILFYESNKNISMLDIVSKS